MSEGWDAFMRALPIPFPAFRRLQGSDELKETVKARPRRLQEGHAQARRASSPPRARRAAARRRRRGPRPWRRCWILALEFDAEYARAEAPPLAHRTSPTPRHMAARLLCGEDGEPTGVRLGALPRWTEVMVDEYQDVSPRAGGDSPRPCPIPGGKLFMVGDVKQSYIPLPPRGPGDIPRKIRALPRDAPPAGGRAAARLPARELPFEAGGGRGGELRLRLPHEPRARRARLR